MDFSKTKLRITVGHLSSNDGALFGLQNSADVGDLVPLVRATAGGRIDVMTELYSDTHQNHDAASRAGKVIAI